MGFEEDNIDGESIILKEVIKRRKVQKAVPLSLLQKSDQCTIHLSKSRKPLTIISVKGKLERLFKDMMSNSRRTLRTSMAQVIPRSNLVVSLAIINTR